MSHCIEYPSDYPDSAQAKIVDVISLVEKKDWNKLNNTIICQDRKGNVTARFGDERWDVSPYKRKANDKGAFDFTAISTSITLQLELKLIVYGWLFHKSGKTNQASSINTLISRLSSIKGPYLFLASINAPSISALSNNKTWAKFEEFLVETGRSRQSLELTFISINSALRLQSWLKVDFGIKPVETTTLAGKLNNKDGQQTLVIPEKIGDAIFGKSIELIEVAYPYRELLAHVESALQANYLEGKEQLDRKISAGSVQWLTDENGNIINTQTYAHEIMTHQPRTIKEIITESLGDIDDLCHIKNGKDFLRYYGQLITACYISCGGFSGMRDSELGALTSDSYYCERFDNRDYHMLQSKTFKLGEKRETWVTAPITEKAISLVANLTKQWRSTLKESIESYNNTLWVNHTARSKPPIIIGDWSSRLQRFCQQFNIIISQGDLQECIESNPRSKDKIAKSIKVGEPWPLAPHQFRRTLAFYTIKHRLGTTISLKQQFKHTYLAMTEWYTSGGKLARLKSLKIDSELQKMLSNVSNENTANKIFNMVHSDQKLSGVHGKAIVQMRNDIPHIYSSWDVIYAAVKSKRLTLHGTAHSYCKNGYECDMDGIVNPAFCVDCNSGSSIIDEDNAKWWQKKHKSLTNYLATEKNISPSEYSHLITQIRAAEIVMKDFGMPFATYNHPIDIIEV